ASGAARAQTQIRLLRKDGATVAVEATVLALDWDHDRSILVVARPVSERRAIDNQLIREDRLAGLGTLAAGVAHEINNPLAYLTLNLQYVLRELPRSGGDPARLDSLLERLGEAEHGARRVKAIIGELRAFSRPEQPERGAVSVRSALEAAVKVTAAALRARATLVETYRAVRLVDANPTGLEQVFVNLLVNAAQALPEGDPERHRVEVELRQEGDRVVAEIRDTGPGIPPEVLERVFDPFFTTKPRGVGTGLGLPISRGIVTALGGEITVASHAGAGSTFRVSLPSLDEPDVAIVRRPTPPPPPVVPRSRILVVDDERPVADMLRRALGDVHEVSVAGDARSALALIRSSPRFDVILCDILMPEMTGLDLHAALRAERPGEEQRIVFMSGGSFSPAVDEFLARTPNRRLAKPFDLAELERVLGRALTEQLS
ncbi:MAG: response regulator, partial [Deltaproteobacteria bacterium]|nr:response regulator [Deltaproteobacteria bacterium]